MENGGVVGKELKVFYDDLGHVSCKEGKCTSNSDSEIELDNKIILQKNRVVRIEVKRGISNE